MPVTLPPHFWLGPLILLAVAGLLFIPSVVMGHIAVQRRAAFDLAQRPAIFWPVLAFIGAGRLALLWAACGGGLGWS